MMGSVYQPGKISAAGASDFDDFPIASVAHASRSCRLRHCAACDDAARRLAFPRDILAKGYADLVAIGREALFDPNWPLHAELALGGGCRELFASWPKQYGWWLERREPGLRRLDGPPLPFRKSS